MNRALQHRLTCRFLWASLLFIGGSVWAQDNKPMIVITPQEVCDYCDTLVDATFDLTGERLYVAARGKNQDGDVYPWLSLWDITRTNQTQATPVLTARSPVMDSDDFMIKLDSIGRLIGVAGKSLKLWYADVNNKTLPYMGTLSQPSSLFAFAFSPKGDKVATGTDGYFLVWDTYRLNNTIPMLVATAGPGIKANSVSFSPSKQLILARGGIWDITQIENEKPKQLVNFDNNGAHIISSPDNKWVASSIDFAYTAYLWITSSAIGGNGDHVAHMDHGDYVSSIIFDTTSRYIVSTSDDGTAKLWDSSSIKDKVPLLLATMDQGCGVLQSLFTLDRTRVFTRGSCNIKLWDVGNIKEDGKATLLNTFIADGGYQKIQLDPAEIWLLTVSDKSVQLWDVAALQPDQEPPTSETDYSE